MNVQMMPAAFDNAGHVDEIVILTSAKFDETMGQPLRSKLAAFVICGGKGVKALEINTGDELVAAIKTYTPSAVSVAGVAAEHEIVKDLERGIAMLLSLPFPLSQEKKNDTHMG